MYVASSSSTMVMARKKRHQLHSVRQIYCCVGVVKHDSRAAYGYAQPRLTTAYPSSRILQAERSQPVH